LLGNLTYQWQKLVAVLTLVEVQDIEPVIVCLRGTDLF